MAASQVSSTAWMLEGDYFEGCNCDIVCPCVFLSDPDEGNCHVTCAWHIQKGNYGDTNLNNLNVVAMFNSPGNMFTGPKWKAALYMDERATQQQKDLITRIYSGQAGGFFAAATNFIGEMLGIKSLPIEFGVDGKRRWLKVKDAVELDIEAIAGADKNRESVLSNSPFSVVPGADMTIARSNKYNYNDHGMEWNNSGKNGFYCRFKYSS
ncbi:MAG: DUF1326 domain-containing protein [Nitrososphaeraceae archaeon]|jgi:hypothetical protein